MEATTMPSSSSSSNRTESAAEFVATVRKEHDVMMEWYNRNDTASLPELQQLRQQHGSKYPESWKKVLNWNGWKDTRKVYLEHVQQHKSSTSSANNKITTAQTTTTTSSIDDTAPPPQLTNDGSALSVAATATNEESTTNDLSSKPKRKSRWGNVSTTSTNGTATAISTNGTTSSLLSTADNAGGNMDTSSGSKRGRWGTTTAPEVVTTTNHMNHINIDNNNPSSELEQLRMQLRSLNYKIDHVLEEANRIDALPHNHRERSVSPPPSYVYVVYILHMCLNFCDFQ